MSVATVVVSYNRLELLRKCLAAVTSQVPAPDEVILVDNGSTDGSLEMVRSEFPGTRIFETGANIGGAGGFAWGLELAIEAGHEFAWLMDDDAEPLPGSLAPLLDVYKASSIRPGFVASAVVGEEGEANRGHLPAIDPDPMKQMAALKLGCIAVDHATFVGALIDLKQAASTHLPYMDFFIWLDDAEYTRRLAHGSLGLCVPESRIMHPDKTGSQDMGGRLFYFVRNHLWLTKLKPGARGIADKTPYKALELAVFGLREQLPHAGNKSLWAKSLGRGLFDGIFRSPRPIMPGDLLATRSGQ